MTVSELTVETYGLPLWPNGSKPLLGRGISPEKWVVCCGDAVMNRAGQWLVTLPRILHTAEWLRSVEFDAPQEALDVYWKAWNEALRLSVEADCEGGAG